MLFVVRCSTHLVHELFDVLRVVILRNGVAAGHVDRCGATRSKGQRMRNRNKRGGDRAGVGILLQPVHEASQLSGGLHTWCRNAAHCLQGSRIFGICGTWLVLSQFGKQVCVQARRSQKVRVDHRKHRGDDVFPAWSPQYLRLKQPHSVATGALDGWGTRWGG